MSRYDGRLPSSYFEAERALRGRPVRTVVNNTRVSRRDEETIEVQFHRNTIATFHVDGSQKFTTCGYATVSTHARLNAMVPASVHFTKRDGVGYVNLRTEGESPHWDPHYGDTLHITPDGEIANITKEH